MSIRRFIPIIPRIVKYNLKVIFAGKFVWFLLAALGFFLFFMFQAVWSGDSELNEALVYDLLLFPCALLVFYPAVFGIQNDEDARILELLFGIPNYKYKVWALRLGLIYVAVFFILLLFGGLASVLLYPLNPLEMSAQLMFPVCFYGSLAFMFSTIIRSGNGTAVLMIILFILILILGGEGALTRSFWNVMLNPFEQPRNILPVIWENTILKNRLWLLCGSIICVMAGLLNLQKRELFLR
jgi:hypothetical protein